MYVEVCILLLAKVSALTYHKKLTDWVDAIAILLQNDAGEPQIERFKIAEFFKNVLAVRKTAPLEEVLAAFCNIKRASCSDIPRRRRPLTLMISSPTANRPSLICHYLIDT